MGAILALLANPVIIRLALGLIDAFVSEKNANAEVQAALKKVAEFLRANGVDKAKTRFEAEDQIAAGDEIWKEREKPKPPEKKS